MSSTGQGLYGRGKRVAAGTVVGAFTAVGQEIALACGTNPTKITGSKRLLPQLSQILDGWRKEDPPTTKKLPEADVPKLLAVGGTEVSSRQFSFRNKKNEGPSSTSSAL